MTYRDDVLQHLWKVFIFIIAADLFNFKRGLECVLMEGEVAIPSLTVQEGSAFILAEDVHVERQVSEQQAQCCVEAQMGSDCVSDFKWGLIRHFRPLLVFLEDWPDFQMYQAINCPLLISVGTSQPSVHQRNWAGYLETFIWFSNLYSGLALFVFCWFFFNFIFSVAGLGSVFLCCICSSYAFAYSAKSGFFGTLTLEVQLINTFCLF